MIFPVHTLRNSPASPKYPSHTYGARPETLLLLAWCSTLDLQALLKKDRQECPWKYPTKQPWDQWQPAFPADLLVQAIAKALACFDDDLYGPALRNLVDFRLRFVDFKEVAHAIGLKNLADPGHGFFFSDDAYEDYSVQQQRETGAASETDAFWQAICQHAALHDRLLHLSETWRGSVCRGACTLQFFFFAYPRLARTYQRAPFFVQEFLRMSLPRVDWHAIAAQVLQTPSLSVCQCEASELEEPLEARVEILGELLGQVGNEIVQYGLELPEPQYTQAFFLVDLCRQTAQAMRLSTLARSNPSHPLSVAR